MHGKRNMIGIFSSSYPLTAIDPLAAQNAIDYLEQNGCRVKKSTVEKLIICYDTCHTDDKDYSLIQLFFVYFPVTCIPSQRCDHTPIQYDTQALEQYFCHRQNMQPAMVTTPESQ